MVIDMLNTKGTFVATILIVPKKDYLRTSQMSSMASKWVDFIFIPYNI